MTTTRRILRYARWLEEVDPDFLSTAILMETGEDYGTRDLLDQVARLIEIFGVIGTAEIVGCPAREVRRDAAAKIRLRDDECAYPDTLRKPSTYG